MITINGRKIFYIPECCSDCPMLDKDEKNMRYSDGYCTMRNIRKNRSSNTPKICIKRFKILGL